MPRIAYVPRAFAPASLALIETANEIIEEYQADGFDLTLRQLYYQFVARAVIPNTLQDYKRLGSILNDARLAGLVDWSAMVDRTRNLETPSHWDDPASIVRSAASSFALDKWDDQDFRVEVWVEKEALAGVVERAATALDLAYFSCRGYVSQSEMWEAARRHLRFEREGQAVRVLHLGDHDPSGIDMTRDIQDRLQLFGAKTEVERIALNRDQVDRYGPPPNPAKLTDSRATSYVRAHGYSSWELDALDPKTLAALIERHALVYRDEARFAAREAQERTDRTVLNGISRRFADVRAFLRK